MLRFFALFLTFTCLIGLTFCAKPETPGRTGDIPQVTALCALINSTNLASMYPDTWDCARLRASPSQICNNTLPGVFCSVYGTLNITYISLISLSLNGTLPSELGLLTTLMMLDFWQNQLVGTIPSSLGSLSLLSYLRLGQNLISGTIPPELFIGTQLQQIDFDQNALTGSLPTQIGLLGSRVTALDVSSNQLTGALPTELGRLYNLQTLNVQANGFRGTIPDTLGSLPAMQYFMLYNNQISGTIPSWLGKMNQMQVLALGYNPLSGTIPSSIGRLSNAVAVYLLNTYVTGAIPTQLGLMTSLTYLDLSSVPSELGGLSALNLLDISRNALSGAVPAAVGSSMFSLNYLDLSQNTALVGGCWPWPDIVIHYCNVRGVSFLCQCNVTQLCQQAPCRASKLPQHSLHANSASADLVRSRDDSMVDRKAIGAIPINSQNWKSTKFAQNIGRSSQ